MELKKITLANFNCTFKIEKEEQPLLNHFYDIFLPAIGSEEFKRVDHKSKNEYYIADVHVEDIGDDEYALIGKHYKRTTLEIRQDYNYEQGEVPINKREKSAPFSTFIILLRNHRIIHFLDQKGSPDIRSFAATVRQMLKNQKSGFETNVTNKAIKVFDAEETWNYDGIAFEDMPSFKKYLDRVHPSATVNVIPIPATDVVDRIFEGIKRINFVRFTLFNLNSEINDEPMFADLTKVMEDTEAKSVRTRITSPENKENVSRLIKKSKGQSDFYLQAITEEGETLKASPGELTEIIKVNVDPDKNVIDIAERIYMNVKDREEIKENSEENLTLYQKFVNKLKSSSS